MVQKFLIQQPQEAITPQSAPDILSAYTEASTALNQFTKGVAQLGRGVVQKEQEAERIEIQTQVRHNVQTSLLKTLKPGNLSATSLTSFNAEMEGITQGVLPNVSPGNQKYAKALLSQYADAARGKVATAVNRLTTNQMQFAALNSLSQDSSDTVRSYRSGKQVPDPADPKKAILEGDIFAGQFNRRLDILVGEGLLTASSAAKMKSTAKESWDVSKLEGEYSRAIVSGQPKEFLEKVFASKQFSPDFLKKMKPIFQGMLATGRAQLGYNESIYDENIDNMVAKVSTGVMNSTDPRILGALHQTTEFYPKKLPKFEQRLEEAVLHAAKIKSIKWASPAERQEILTRPVDPSDPHFALKQKINIAAGKEAANLAKEARDNPVAYFLPSPAMQNAIHANETAATDDRDQKVQSLLPIPVHLLPALIATEKHGGLKDNELSVFERNALNERVQQIKQLPLQNQKDEIVKMIVGDPQEGLAAIPPKYQYIAANDLKKAGLPSASLKVVQLQVSDSARPLVDSAVIAWGQVDEKGKPLTLEQAYGETLKHHGLTTGQFKTKYNTSEAASNYFDVLSAMGGDTASDWKDDVEHGTSLSAQLVQEGHSPAEAIKMGSNGMHPDSSYGSFRGQVFLYPSDIQADTIWAAQRMVIEETQGKEIEIPASVFAQIAPRLREEQGKALLLGTAQFTMLPTFQGLQLVDMGRTPILINGEKVTIPFDQMLNSQSEFSNRVNEFEAKEQERFFANLNKNVNLTRTLEENLQTVGLLNEVGRQKMVQLFRNLKGLGAK